MIRLLRRCRERHAATGPPRYAEFRAIFFFFFTRYFRHSFLPALRRFCHLPILFYRLPGPAYVTPALFHHASRGRVLVLLLA